MTTPSARPAKPKNAGAWVNAHPGETAALVGALIGVVVLVHHGRSIKKPAQTPTGMQIAPGYLLPPTADTQATDVISAVQPEIDTLERQVLAYRSAVDKINNPTPGTTPPAPGVPANTTAGQIAGH